MLTIKEIREKSNEELAKEIASLKEELYTMRFQQATGSLENPMRLRETRKTIARMLTVMTERNGSAGK